jgi:dTMP kinase
MKGRFISFEGIDGTGKSTQITLLAERMKQEGYDVLVTKEPGSPIEPTKLGLELRQILFHTVTTHNMASGVADLLFLADHIQHVEKLIKPALEEGKTIICDRYTDSQFAYAATHKCPAHILEAYAASFGPIPDVTFLFVSSDPEVTLARAQARRGETHQDGKTWNRVQDQINVQREYLSRLIGQARTIVIAIDPKQTPAQVAEIIWVSLLPYLSRPIEYIEGESSKVIAVDQAF